MRSLAVVGAVILLVGCGPADDGTIAPNNPAIDEARVAAGRSHAHGLWQPSAPAECSKSLHDTYAVRGPDGKLYPTWHPPADRSGCSFGHEHGRDPSASALVATIGAVPFGYANAMLAGTSNYITTPAGQQLAYWDPHFAVFAPSRYYDPAAAGLLGRPTGACYLIETNGDRARGGACDWSTNYGRIAGMAFDDPRSAFDGAEREFYFNQTTVTNPGGPTAWFTDPFGRNARPSLYPGAIKQFISSGSNVRPFPLESQAFGARRRYDGLGTHAPN